MTETSPPENLVMPLHAEEMVVAKRQVARTVRVTRETRSRDTLVEEALTQTGVVIERVPMGQFIEAMPPVREEGDLTILPVVEEVVVTTRRLRLVEEVRIRRVQTTSNYVETVKLREQHVVVTRSEPVIHHNPNNEEHNHV
jgi:stress response protein YsnF